MFDRLLRTFIMLPALLVLLIVVPSVAFSYGEPANQTGNWQAGTISPLPTPTKPGTVPPPTATATRRPWPTATPTRKGHYRHRPVATATATPTATPAPRTGELALIDGVSLKLVIGDRLSSTIYAYTQNNWLYRSPDDGVTWQLMTTQPAVQTFIMSAADPNVLYSGQGTLCDGLPRPLPPLYKSSDGGVNWSRLAGGDGLRPLLAHPSDVNSLFAAGCDAPYLSTDGGLTWAAKVDPSIDNLWQTYRVVDMTAAARIGNPPPATPGWGQIFAGAVAADGSGIVVFTNDLGDSWVRLTPNVYPASWGMKALAVDLLTEGLVAFAEPRSVWQTSNYGVNWQITTKGLETVAQRDVAGGVFGLNDLVYHPSGRLYLATVRGLYTREFTAQVWNKITGVGYEESNLTSLLFTETNPGLIWINSDDGVYVDWLR
jgi:photosystem II stability/assembly factor-like uncharacterized protein